MTKKISEKEKISGFKGFNPDMSCLDFQYEVGKEYEENNEIKACNKGFNFCENPFDVFNYYPPFSAKGLNRFCIVNGYGEIDKDRKDSKVACSKINIYAEISLKGMIEAGVNFILKRVDWKKTTTGYKSAATNTGDCSAATNTGYKSAATNTGDCSAATNTGYKSAATNTGDCSAATNTGDKSAATNTGDKSVATNTGYKSVATNTGDYSAATNTGYKSVATNTGYKSAATNTGYKSAATNTGDRSKASVKGKDSVAIVTGYNSKAMGALGCWIVLTEREKCNGEIYPIKEVKAFKVDGEKVKDGTWYMLINGELVETEHN